MMVETTQLGELHEESMGSSGALGQGFGTDVKEDSWKHMDANEGVARTAGWKL